MPTIQKTLLSGSVQPLLTHPIPKVCKDARTIVDTPFSLFFFKDSSRLNHEYVQTVLPSLFSKNFTAEQHVKWFKNLPEGSFLEFDKGKRLLFLCSLAP
jgi:hypothetical protein